MTLHRIPKQFKASAPARAFTLVELLIVMAILATLIGLVSATFTAYTTRAQRDGTQAVISRLAMAVEEFRELYGSYPYHDPAADPTAGTYSNLSGDIDNTSWANYEIRNLYGLLRETGCIKEPIQSRFLREVEAAGERLDPNAHDPSYNLVVLDGWEQPLAYRFPRWDGSEYREDRFDLWSTGPSRNDARNNPGDPLNPTDRTPVLNQDNIVWGDF